MSRHFGLLGSAAAIALVCSPCALAQDASFPPLSGVMNLSGGFTPDPQGVALEAGGGDVSASCAANIHAAPDVVLSYSSGGSSNALVISVTSATSAALLVEDPSGDAHCNGASSPSLTFATPASGDYAIWIGGPGTATEATLSVSSAAPP